jgi:hypothetical protein
MVTASGARPTYLVRLTPLPGVDGTRALRLALKMLLRRHGLKAVELKEEEGAPPGRTSQANRRDDRR